MVIERHIKSIWEDARTMLVHQIHVWLEVVTKVFWPFAIKMTCRTRNKFSVDTKRLNPEMESRQVKMSSEV